MTGITNAELEAIYLSLQVAGWAVLWTFPPGLFLAWWLSRSNMPGKSLIDTLIHLPLIMPPVVTGYVLLVLLGRRGAVGSFLYETLGISFAFTWQGAAIAAGIMAFPLMVRSIRLSVDGLDQGMEAAARSLGAGPLRVFFTISLPLILPGIITGAILAFAKSMGEFGATITFVSNIPGETRTIPLALYSLIQSPGGEEAAFRLCVIAVIISMFALFLSNSLHRFITRILSGT